MATVFQRFNEIGLTGTHTDLIRVGEEVARAYKEEQGGIVDKVEQIEDNRVFMVNNYPNEWTSRMDYVIILWCAEQYKKLNPDG